MLQAEEVVERPDKPTAPWLKKPQLPPPMKKPQRTGSGLSPNNSSAPSVGIVHPQPSHIKSSPNVESAPAIHSNALHDRNGETGEAGKCCVFSGLGLSPWYEQAHTRILAFY